MGVDVHVDILEVTKYQTEFGHNKRVADESNRATAEMELHLAQSNASKLNRVMANLFYSLEIHRS